MRHIRNHLRKLHLLALTCFLIPLSAPAFEFDLLFSEDDLPTIRNNTRLPLFADFWQVFQNLKRPGIGFHRDAFVYLVNQDPARRESAIKGLMELVQRDKWHQFQDADGTPVGFLRCAAHTAHAAMVYDWLYDDLTSDQRRAIRDAIANKGCQPLFTALRGMRYPETVLEWQFVPEVAATRSHIDMKRWPTILSKNNFRAVINGGLALGLFTVADDPRAADWEDMLLHGILQFNNLFKKDGSYDEAIAYVNYAMKYQIMAMEVVERKRGINYFDTANFTGLIDFVLAMYLPSHSAKHGSVSFGDAGPSLESNTAYWIASQSRDGVAQYLGNHYADHYWTSLLYYDPTVREEAPTEEFDLIKTDLDWIIARTGYQINDLVLAMRSGGPMNHEHADRNSLQFKAFGEILWSDPGKVTYDSASPEWILRTAQGHNMLLIDGKGIQYHDGLEGTNAGLSSAKIVRAYQREKYAVWASDATPAYKLIHQNVESVTRSVCFIPEIPCIVVADKVTLASPAKISARWHMESRDQKGEILLPSANTAEFKRPKASLRMLLAGTSTPTFSANSLAFPEGQTEYHFVDGATTDEEQSVLLITVATAAPNGSPHPDISIRQTSDSMWQITPTTSANTQPTQPSLLIIDNGTLPEFSVLP